MRQQLDSGPTSFEQGQAHIVRQIYGHFEDKTLLVHAFKGFFADPDFRGG